MRLNVKDHWSTMFKLIIVCNSMRVAFCCAVVCVCVDARSRYGCMLCLSHMRIFRQRLNSNILHKFAYEMTRTAQSKKKTKKKKRANVLHFIHNLWSTEATLNHVGVIFIYGSVASLHSICAKALRLSSILCSWKTLERSSLHAWIITMNTH